MGYSFEHTGVWCRALCLGAVLIAAGGCGDDDGGDAGDAATGASSHTWATYNGGLARSFVDYAVERSPHLVEALSAEGERPDVLCVQEFWEQEDWDALRDGFADYEALRMADDPGDAGTVETCTPAEIEPLEACVRNNCDVPPGELTSCALVMCDSEVGALSAGCLGCVTGVIGDVDVDAVVAACGPGGSGGGSGYAYGGSFGTGLLSALPVIETDELLLESTTNRRGVLYAQLDPGGGAEPLHVFCTHLSANLASVPYTGQFGGWAEEQADQIDRMLEFVQDSVPDADAPVVLLGDFNTGPAVGDAVAELPDNFAMFSAAGFEAPFTEADDAGCSFCASNPLVGGGDSVLIDHVMLRGLAGASVTPELFLTDELELEVEGEPVTTRYSDHYGVRVRLEP